MSNITQMDLIKADIEYNAQGLTNKDIARNIIHEWRGSKPINDMKEAFMYYKVQNTAIEKKTRNYEDENGNIIKNEHLSNVKSKSAQYRKSVNQKLNFALAKPFVISCDNEKYEEEWKNFLSDKIRATITRVGLDGINKGIGWAYPWINEKGELEIIDTVPETIYPAWHDTAHTELDYLVRDYKVTQYTSTLSPQDIQKVEYWDKNIVEKYIDYSDGIGVNGDLVPDTNGEYELSDEEEERTSIQQTHLKNNDGTGKSWERVPFIAFKGNRDELPLLNECKSDIDNYDMLKSKSIDSLLDDIDPILVVEDISPEMGELARARKLLQNSRIMTVDHGGSAEFKKVDTDVTHVISELEMIKKDILDNTSTVDLTTIQLGTNPSGNAMKAFYESLNTWCNGYEEQFRVFMYELKYFFDKWLSWRGGFGSFEQLQEIQINFTLDRDMMLNESEIIQNLGIQSQLLSQRTLDEMNPWIDDPDMEEERRKEEREEQEEYDQQRIFEQVVRNNDKTDENENDENLEEET